MQLRAHQQYRAQCVFLSQWLLRSYIFGVWSRRPTPVSRPKYERMRVEWNCFSENVLSKYWSLRAFSISLVFVYSLFRDFLPPFFWFHSFSILILLVASLPEEKRRWKYSAQQRNRILIVTFGSTHSAFKCKCKYDSQCCNSIRAATTEHRQWIHQSLCMASYAADERWVKKQN